MRWMVPFLLLLIASTALNAQNLQGKWKGYFVANADPLGKMYQYELDIIESPRDNYKAKSYTQFNGPYSATANAAVTFDKSTGLVSIEEYHFDALKISSEFQACLMRNFLNYKNLNGHEILEGTYTSKNNLSQKDCGGGQVYLEKYTPLAAYIKTPANKTIAKKELASSNNKSNLIPKTNTTQNNNQNIVLQKLDIKTTKEEEQAPEEIKNETTSIDDKSNNLPQDKNLQPVPWVLVVRENKLVKKITTPSKEFTIDLYDNGTIDNDTINVYDNKQLIVNKKRLSYKAIHLAFNFNAGVEEHEVIIVAHNMGTVPPNTALLVLKDGNTRQEFFITSTNKSNAKLIIAYDPPKPN